jgi:malate dehydrogenase (oxaloacetate-decarboxylating)(NADP+)
MNQNSKRREALLYHAKPTQVKLVPTKKYATQRDLSLAYTPGVAEPCLEIAKMSIMYTNIQLKVI